MNSETTNRSQDQITQAEQLKKTAELIANGEISIPVDWPQAKLNQLLDLVHDARRKRLLRFFAKTIAKDICRRDQKPQGRKNVKTKI